MDTRCWMLLTALVAPLVQASDLRMEGDVHLDYYVDFVDADGFESVTADFDVERVVNDGARVSPPLVLAGWLTRNTRAEGSGREVATLDIGRFAPGEAAAVTGAAWADDAPPGEYVVHALLQERDAPEVFVDSRRLAPTLLWRGGLEAIGPLRVDDYGEEWQVSFQALHNNRIDARYTNPITLTLYATYGFGPASEGYTLCRATVAGLYAGDWQPAPGFYCFPEAPPPGEYTLHLMVAESGGRGGWSTLSGPDAYLDGGHVDTIDTSSSSHVHYGGGSGVALLAALLAGITLRRFGGCSQRGRILLGFLRHGVHALSP